MDLPYHILSPKASESREAFGSLAPGSLKEVREEEVAGTQGSRPPLSH